MKHKKRRVINPLVKRAYVTPDVPKPKPAPEIRLPAVKAFVSESSTALQAHRIEQEAWMANQYILEGDFEGALYFLMGVHQAVGNLIQKMGYTDEQISKAYAELLQVNTEMGCYDRPAS